MRRPLSSAMPIFGGCLSPQISEKNMIEEPKEYLSTILPLLQRDGNNSLQGASEGKPNTKPPSSLASGLSQSFQAYLVLAIALSAPAQPMFARICAWRSPVSRIYLRPRNLCFLYTPLATSHSFGVAGLRGDSLLCSALLLFFLTHQ